MCPRSLKATKWPLAWRNLKQPSNTEEPSRETPVDLAPQIVVGMQSLRDGTEGHRLTGRLEPEKAVHRR